MARHLLRVVRSHLLLPWKCSGGLCYLKHARDRDSCVNYKQFLDVFVETQPCVVDLKDPVNKGFDQPQLVTKKIKESRIVFKDFDIIAVVPIFWINYQITFDTQLKTAPVKQNQCI